MKPLTWRVRCAIVAPSGPKESCKAVLGNSLIMGLQKYFEIDFSRMESFIKRPFKNVLMGQNVHSGLWILIKAQNKIINRVHGVLGSSVCTRRCRGGRRSPEILIICGATAQTVRAAQRRLRGEIIRGQAVRVHR